MSSRTHVPDEKRFDYVLQVGMNEMQRLRLASDDIDATGKRKERTPVPEPVEMNELSDSQRTNAARDLVSSLDANGNGVIGEEEQKAFLAKHNLNQTDFEIFKKNYTMLLQKNQNEVVNSIKELTSQVAVTRATVAEVKRRRQMFKEVVENVQKLENMSEINCAIEILYGYLNKDYLEFLLRLKRGDSPDQILQTVDPDISDDKKQEIKDTIENLQKTLHFYDPNTNVEKSWCFEYDTMTLMARMNKTLLPLVLPENDIKTRFDQFTGNMNTETFGVNVEKQHRKSQIGDQEFNIITEYIMNTRGEKMCINVDDQTYIDDLVRDRLATQFKFYVEFLRKENKGGELSRLLFKQYENIDYYAYVAEQMRYDETPCTLPDGMCADAGLVYSGPPMESQILLKKLIYGFNSIIDGAAPKKSACERKIKEFMTLSQPKSGDSAQQKIEYMAKYIELIMEASACKEYGWFGKSFASVLLMNNLLRSLYVNDGKWSTRETLIIHEIDAGLQSGVNVEYWNKKANALVRSCVRITKKVTVLTIQKLIPKAAKFLYNRLVKKYSSDPVGTAFAVTFLPTWLTTEWLFLGELASLRNTYGFVINSWIWGLNNSVGAVESLWLSGGIMVIYGLLTLGIAYQAGKYVWKSLDLQWDEMMEAIDKRDYGKIVDLIDNKNFNLTLARRNGSFDVNALEYAKNKKSSNQIIELLERKTKDAESWVEMMSAIDEGNYEEIVELITKKKFNLTLPRKIDNVNTNALKYAKAKNSSALIINLLNRMTQDAKRRQISQNPT